eukprot:m51a1_g4814 hypothetical protein (575) ;mRNA; f:140579-142484
MPCRLAVALCLAALLALATRGAAPPDAVDVACASDDSASSSVFLASAHDVAPVYHAVLGTPQLHAVPAATPSARARGAEGLLLLAHACPAEPCAEPPALAFSRLLNGSFLPPTVVWRPPSGLWASQVSAAYDSTAGRYAVAYACRACGALGACVPGVCLAETADPTSAGPHWRDAGVVVSAADSNATTTAAVWGAAGSLLWSDGAAVYLARVYAHSPRPLVGQDAVLRAAVPGERVALGPSPIRSPLTGHWMLPLTRLGDGTLEWLLLDPSTHALARGAPCGTRFETAGAVAASVRALRQPGRYELFCSVGGDSWAVGQLHAGASAMPRGENGESYDVLATLQLVNTTDPGDAALVVRAMSRVLEGCGPLQPYSVDVDASNRTLLLQVVLPDVQRADDLALAVESPYGDLRSIDDVGSKINADFGVLVKKFFPADRPSSSSGPESESLQARASSECAGQEPNRSGCEEHRPLVPSAPTPPPLVVVAIVLPVALLVIGATAVVTASIITVRVAREREKAKEGLCFPPTSIELMAREPSAAAQVPDSWLKSLPEPELCQTSGLPRNGSVGVESKSL